jgi:protocatechuate 3,4-dioxygenase beta subunit
MKTIYFILFVFIINTGLFAHGAEKSNHKKSTFTLSGQVLDKNNGEALVGVAVKIGEQTAYTDFDGKFSFQEMTPGQYSVETTYVAYKQEKIDVNLKENKEFTINLINE